MGRFLRGCFAMLGLGLVAACQQQPATSAPAAAGSEAVSMMQTSAQVLDPQATDADEVATLAMPQGARLFERLGRSFFGDLNEIRKRRYLRVQVSYSKSGFVYDGGHARGFEAEMVRTGTKYLAFLRDRYFADPAIDPATRVDFAWAAYNAGPARVQPLRETAAERGLDPNRWFFHVEKTAAETIGRETVDYVASINKYYLAYRLAYQARQNRDRAKAVAGS